MIFPRLSRAPVTFALLVIIFLVFVAEWWLGALQNDDVLVAMGAIVPGMMHSHREWWRALAAMFLHGGNLHWATNSFTLYQLGTLFETMFGSGRFALVYFVSGIVASIASSTFAHGPAVGASGAILGILGAFFFSIKRSPTWRHEPWTRSLLSQLLFWAGVNLALGFFVRNIDNVAHFAGLTTGLVLGFLPHRVPPPPPGASVIDVTPQGSV